MFEAKHTKMTLGRGLCKNAYENYFPEKRGKQIVLLPAQGGGGWAGGMFAWPVPCSSYIELSD